MAADTPIEIRCAIPAVATYRRLRREAGMTDRAPEAARIGLDASLFSVLACYAEQPVGMGRVIGDGGCFFQVCDVGVVEAWQRRGIGHRLMMKITAWLDTHAPVSAFISLIADDESPRLYRHHGFVATAPAGIGMKYCRCP